MRLPPLHQSTGKLTRSFTIGPVYVMASVAEDPTKSLLLRNWSNQYDDGSIQRDMFFCIARITKLNDDGEMQRGLSVVIGPLSLCFAILPRTARQPATNSSKE